MDYDLKALDPTLPRTVAPKEEPLPAWAGGYDMQALDPTVKKAEAMSEPQPESAPPMTWREAAWKALTNTPKSAVEYGKNLVDPLLHPVDTAKALGNTAVGAAQLATGSPLGMDDSTAFARAVGDYYANRYGGMDKFKQALANDPVGVAGDIAGVLAIGGGTASRLGKIAGLSKLADAGGLMSTASTWVDPMSGPVRALSEAPRAIWGQGLPEKLYGASLKPSTTLTPEERASVIQAGLEEKIPVSYGGAVKTGQIRRDLAQQLDDALMSADQPVIDKTAAADRMDRSLRNAFMSYDPSGNMARVMGVRDKFLNDPLIPDYLTPKIANKMKQSIYNEIDSAYGNLRAPMASEAKKDLARGLKEEVNAAVPEVVPINDRLSSLIQLADQLQPAGNRVANRNPIGLTATTAAAAGAPGGNAMLSGGLGLLLSSPWYGSRLAMLLDNSRQGIVGPSFRLGDGRYGFSPAARGLLQDADVAYDQGQ